MDNLKITFYEGGDSVTGINFLLEGAGKKILVDAGLSTMCVSDDFALGEPFPYKPEEIDCVFVSHADLTHAGKLPRLIKEGFKGVVYSTLETKKLSEILFRDCLIESSKEASVVFTENDIQNTMKKWETFSYGESIEVCDGLLVDVYDAGHVLGSSLFNFNFKGKSVLFANSIGGQFLTDLSGMPKDKKVDYLITESVYGNKVHKFANNREGYLEDVIEGAINQGGSVVISVSSVDKIFVMLRDINKLKESGKIPSVPTIISSPVALETFDLYGRLFRCDKNICESLEDFVKRFEKLEFINDKERISESIDNKKSKIIISGAGLSGKHMSDFIIKKYISDPNSVIIFPDYQISGSVGRLIQEGNDSIKIGNDSVPVSVAVENIDGYSSHGDHNTLFKFVESFKSSLKKVYVAVGEPDASSYLASKIRDYIGINSEAVQRNKSYEIEL